MIEYADDQVAALTGADALILMTEWQHFRAPEWSEIAEALKGRYVYDGRNIYSPESVESAGLIYHGIGRGCRS